MPAMRSNLASGFKIRCTIARRGGVESRDADSGQRLLHGRRLTQDKRLYRDCIWLLTNRDNREQYRSLLRGSSHHAHVTGSGVGNEEEILIWRESQCVWPAPYWNRCDKLSVIDVIHRDCVRIEVSELQSCVGGDDY